MVPRVFVTSIISDINIIALVSKVESRRHVLAMHDPSIGRVENSVLEEERGFSQIRISRLM